MDVAKNGIGWFFYLVATEMKALHSRPAQLRPAAVCIESLKSLTMSERMCVCVHVRDSFQLLPEKQKYAEIGANYICHS